MTTAELVTLTDTSEGFATILIARGPGTGINRTQTTIRNETAITEYGPRETIEDFPDAVDAADLLAKAQARLAELSNPAKFQQLTVRVSGQPFRLGQRIRVSDGELGFTTTAKITGIDADETSTTLTLGDAPASLLDVINAKDAEERRDIALGLPTPVSVQLVPTPTGMTVLVTLGANSRAVGVEVHVSPVNGFTPDVSTLAARGPGVRFVIEGLATAIRHFVRVRAYDDRGNFSPFTDQLSTAARGVGAAELVVGQIDLTNAERADAALSVKTSAGTEVLRLGNITGKTGVPGGTQYGLWGEFGTGVWMRGSIRVRNVIWNRNIAPSSTNINGSSAFNWPANGNLEFTGVSSYTRPAPSSDGNAVVVVPVVVRVGNAYNGTTALPNIVILGWNVLYEPSTNQFQLGGRARNLGSALTSIAPSAIGIWALIALVVEIDAPFGP